MKQYRNAFEGSVHKPSLYTNPDVLHFHFKKFQNKKFFFSSNIWKRFFRRIVSFDKLSCRLIAFRQIAFEELSCSVFRLHRGALCTAFEEGRRDGKNRSNNAIRSVQGRRRWRSVLVASSEQRWQVSSRESWADDATTRRGRQVFHIYAPFRRGFSSLVR